MKNFDCKRYWLVLKQNVIQGRKRFLTSYAGIFLGLFLAFMAVSIGTRFNPLQDYTQNGAAITFGVFMLGCLVFGSAVLGHLDTKTARITALMLPATNLEKFLVRLTLCLPVYWVLYVPVFLAADAAQMLTTEVIGGHGQWIAPVLWQELTYIGDYIGNTTAHPGEKAFYVLWNLIATYVFTYSIYIFGSAVFRKRAFILTSVILFVANILSGYMMLSVGTREFQSKMGADALSIFFIVLMFAGAAGLVFATYKLFCRIQVVVPKLFGK
ncbi:MAG: hypothetical protein ACI3X6_07985 [Alloprevotella sp.]